MSLRASSKYRFYVLASVALFGFGAAIFTFGFVRVHLWPLLVLGLCCLVFAILGLLQLRDRPQMVITADSFTIRAVFGPQTYRWGDIGHFSPGPPHRSFETVSFDFAAGHPSGGWGTVLTWITRMLTGSDRNFPNLTDLRTDHLIDVLNRRGGGESRA